MRQETVWLGDLPVAAVKKDAAGLFQFYPVQADHLNTPRVILNSANTPVWRWDATDAFGTVLPNGDPDGDGSLFEYNLRFPGQFYDKETGLHYNTFRDYDPVTGRYIDSDPIGLAGGINTYGYVMGIPISWVDPLGLAPGDPFTTMDGAAMDAINWVYSNYPRDPKEFAGSVYQNIHDKQWYATIPKRSENEDESIPSYPNFWEGTESGYYHTHGQCTTNHIEDDFSRPNPKYPNMRSDTKQSWASQKPSYIGTPGGFIKRFNPAPLTGVPGSGTTTTLQQGKCCPGENYP